MKRWNSTLNQKTPLKRTPFKKKPYQLKRKPLNKLSPKQKTRIMKLAQMLPPEDGLCQSCRQKPDFRGLAKHHKAFRSQGGNDDTSNLIWVCGKCHAQFHGIKEK